MPVDHFERRLRSKLPARLQLAPSDRTLCRQALLPGRSFFRRVAILLLLSCAGTAVAAGQEDEKADIDRQTALVVAKTHLEAAQNARMAAQIQALGLSSGATGTTELKEKGGEFEAWLLSAQSIDRAADEVIDSLPAEPTPRPIVLLAGAEAFDLTLASVVEARLRYVQSRLTSELVEAGCSPSGAEPAIAAAAGAPIIPAIGALLSALKTDTKISGIEGPSDARLLVNALTRRSSRRWLIPTDVSLIPAESTIGNLWEAVSDLRTSALTCRSQKPQTNAGKAEAADLTGAIAIADKAEVDLVTSNSGLSPLLQAIRLSQIAEQNPLVMRLFVEKGGGSILLRKNLWTALGAPAVGITGGSVISWRLVEPASGHAMAGGLLLCRTKLTNMRSVHGGRAAEADCSSANERN